MRRSSPAIGFPYAEGAALAGGEEARLAGCQNHAGDFCCSMYCLITDNGAPPQLRMQ